MDTDDDNVHRKVWNSANSREHLDRQQHASPSGGPQPGWAPPVGPTGQPPQANQASQASPPRWTVRPSVSWPLVLGLGAIALLRPLARIAGVDDAIGTPSAALLLTLLITGAWLAIVGLGRVPRPVLTLTLAGLAYGFYVIPLSAILSVGLTGTLQGPVDVPFAIIPILVTNALWGAVAGTLALAVQNLRRPRP